MIYDLDAGRPERPARSGARMTAVTVVAISGALLYFAALAFAPGQRAAQTPILTFSAPAMPTLARPTFNTKPVPDRTLVLSDEDAITTFRITSLGQTGLVKNDSVATTYRLRATGDVVTVAPLPESEALPYSSPLVFDPPLRVRGRAAEATLTFNGVSAIRWIENGTVFEMSSRTLNVTQLAELANKLR
ncbi:MAG: hypothetical protein ABJB39_10085 [Chloroflexota bacterium]